MQTALFDEQHQSTNKSGKFLSPDDQVWIDHLATKWEHYHQADLRLRHETGATAGQKIKYDPAKRQQRGEKVQKLLADRLGISRSEVTRMLQFAHEFKSFQDFEREHPTVRTWTGVKKLLPKCDETPKRKRKTKTASKTKELRLELSRVTKKLKGFSFKEDSEAERLKWLQLFQELAQAVNPELGVRLTVSVLTVDDDVNSQNSNTNSGI
jgi:hypothetical protein